MTLHSILSEFPYKENLVFFFFQWEKGGGEKGWKIGGEEGKGKGGKGKGGKGKGGKGITGGRVE
jgi:hypothetical protein